jgi:energy-coupling factor transport system ATP-binding protein
VSGPIVELDHVSYWYPAVPTPALDDVSLSLWPGEFVVLAGASGSGKSSLMGAISGLVPHFHGGRMCGQVLVAGVDTRDAGPASLSQSVGTLFQDPETQVVMGTVRAELAFPLENRGFPAPAVARAVEEAALSLGVSGLLGRTTTSLSGGELQRVALGAALAGRPSVLVLDEPTSQLDPVAGDELIGSLRRLNEDFSVTVVLAEHRLERCLPFADRVLAMEDGRLAFDGPPAGFLEWAPPEMQTPGARLLRRLGLPPVAGVKAARAALREAGVPNSDAISRAYREKSHPSATVLAFDRVWHELRDGPAILRSLSLSVGDRERVALMGRNGAGKSTLLRHAAGLMKPTRGRIETTGRVALLLQNPTDYLIHDTVAQEASERALGLVGLTVLRDRHPGDLSGGEKQRLALAIVLDGDDTPAVVCLDEPTRGMDRKLKHELAELLKGLPSATIVATHDPEFVAAFADRVVLLADGTTIADGPTHEILSGGTYFATETARITDGAALTPDEPLIERSVHA